MWGRLFLAPAARGTWIVERGTDFACDTAPAARGTWIVERGTAPSTLINKRVAPNFGAAFFA